MKRQSTEFSHEPVCNAAGQPAREPSILPLKTPAADNVVAFAEFCYECRNLGRIVLEVPIHGDDNLSLSEIESGLKSGRLAKIPPQPDRNDAGILVA